jgi:hypothetical protein
MSSSVTPNSCNDIYLLDNMRDGQTETTRAPTIQEQYFFPGFRFPAVTVKNREIILTLV